MKKRILSIVLTICMLISAFPMMGISVSAAGENWASMSVCYSGMSSTVRFYPVFANGSFADGTVKFSYSYDGEDFTEITGTASGGGYNMADVEQYAYYGTLYYSSSTDTPLKAISIINNLKWDDIYADNSNGDYPYYASTDYGNLRDGIKQYLGDEGRIKLETLVSTSSGAPYGTPTIGGVALSDITGAYIASSDKRFWTNVAYSNSRAYIYDGDWGTHLNQDKGDILPVIISTEFGKTVVDYACEIVGGDGYETIAAALADASNGDTIKLLKDTSEAISIESDMDVTLDLNNHILGKKITSNAKSVPVILVKGVLTVIDSTMEGDNPTGTVRYFTDTVCLNDDEELIEGQDGCFETLYTGNDVPSGVEGTDYVKVIGGCITSANLGTGISTTNNTQVTFDGGNIVGCLNTDGGAVINNGTFIMNGGSFVGNACTAWGGAVTTAGDFTMNDGLIAYNTSMQFGGGVCIGEKDFKMHGGTITGNVASAGGGVAGYPIGIKAPVLKMDGGIISGNYAADLGMGASVGNGVFLIGVMIVGGTAKVLDNVYNNEETNTCVMSPIEIGTSTDGTDGNGVMKPASGMDVGITLLDEEFAPTCGAFTTNGSSTDTEYFFSDNDDYSVIFVTDHLELGEASDYACEIVGGDGYETIAAALADASNGDTIKLLKNVVESVTVAKDTTVTLDLNGYVLCSDDVNHPWESSIINNGNLTIMDSDAVASVHKVHYFTDEKCDDDITVGEPCQYCGGVAVKDGMYETYTDEAPQDMTGVRTVIGGCISGNMARSAIANNTGAVLTYNGGCIIGNNSGIDSYGDCTVNGGSMIGNRNGIITIAYNTFTINDCLITDNCVVQTIHNLFGTFIMNGGTITANRSETAGGIFSEAGTLIIAGGEITDNIADTVGGVCSLGKTYVGGSAKITGNTGSMGNNLVLMAPVELGTSTDGTDGNGVMKPASGMDIGITLLDGEFAPTCGAFTTNGSSTDTEYFFSDNDDYSVIFVTDHLELGEASDYACEIVGGDGYETIAAALEDVTAGDTIKLLKDAEENVTVASGKEVTLDLNDKVLSGDGTTTVIYNAGTLTITDTSASKTTRYFTDSKCLHGNVNGTVCENCGVCAHGVVKYAVCWDCAELTDWENDASQGGTNEIAAADGCFETLYTGSGVPSGVEGKDYVAVAGGVITGGTGYREYNKWSEQYTCLGGGVFSYGTITLNSVAVCGNRTGYFSADIGSAGGGGVCFKDGTSEKAFTIIDCVICGNSTAGSGGGVNVGSNCTMTGTTVSYNTAKESGGIVTVSSLEMTDCTVKGNKALKAGGGIRSSADTSVIVLNNCLITDNKAGTYGGGIYQCGLGDVYINDGTRITDNYAADFAGGVDCDYYVDTNVTPPGSYGDIYVSGDVQITGNKSGSASNMIDDNFYLRSGAHLSVDAENPLCEDAEIGVRLQSVTGNVTAYNSEDYSEYFTSDNTDYVVINNVSPSGQLVQIGEPEIPEDVAAIKYSTAITLGENFKVSLRLTNIADTVDASKLTIEVNGTTYDNLTVTKGMVTLTDIAEVSPEDIGAPINAVVNYDGTKFKTVNCSVKTYCTAVLTNQQILSNSKYTTLVNLCTEVLKYGKYAAVYAYGEDENNTAEALSGFITLDADFNGVSATVDHSGTLDAPAGSLKLDSDVSLVFTYGVSLEGYTIEIQNGTGDWVEDFTVDGNKVIINGRHANVFGRTYEVRITDSKGARVSTDVYTVNGYCLLAQTASGASQELKDLCQALYLYGVASAAYKPAYR